MARGLGTWAPLLAGVLAVGILWVAIDRPPADLADSVPPSTADRQSPPAGLAAAATNSLSKAVAAGDQRAAGALAPRGNDEAADQLMAMAANAESLRITGLDIEYVGGQPEPVPDGAEPGWVDMVDVGWRLEDARRPSRVRVGMGFEAVGDRVAITSVLAGSEPLPLWLAGSLQVRRQVGTLVLAAGQSGQSGSGAVDLGSYSRAASQAVDVVRRVLPQWRDQLVVEVPASAGDLDELLGRPQGASTEIAAVTGSADGADGPPRVFVNPEQWDQLDSLGRLVVASHEATHVAMNAQRSRAPLWLVEGFADYVALRDVELSDRELGRALLEQVGRDGVPARLPTAANFEAGSEAGSGDADAAYQGAWLACELLVEAGGEQELVAFYRMVDAGEPVDTALRSSFGLSRAELTRRWRQRVSDLAT